MRKPIKLNSRTIYENRYLSIKVDTLQLGEKMWEQAYFTKPNNDGVGVLAYNEAGIFLQKEYRYASDDFFWQMPMGMVDIGVDITQAAKNELKEEAGITADTTQEIGLVVAEPGMSPQKTHVFVAQGLKVGERHLAENEISEEVRQFSLQKLDEMIENGEITCGFTLSALHLFKLKFLKK